MNIVKLKPNGYGWYRKFAKRKTDGVFIISSHTRNRHYTEHEQKVTLTDYEAECLFWFLRAHLKRFNK